MANSGPANIVIEYDDSGGTLRDISQHVLTINDIDIESLTEEKHSFGDSWEEHLAIGIGRMAPVTFGGLYDDDAAVNGPNTLFAGRIPEAVGTATRTLRITWRSGKTTTVETILKNYKRTAARDGLTKYEVTLQPTGAVTEA